MVSVWCVWWFYVYFSSYLSPLLCVYCGLHCIAFARFSEAILDYLADEQRASSGQVQFSHFEGHIFSSFDQLFNVWLPSKESRVSCVCYTSF